MLGPIVDEAYDYEGTRTLIPVRGSSRAFRPTSPMGRFVAGQLEVQCRSLEEVRGFLGSCRYVSDEEQFGRRDYWLEPERFEKTRAGDCEDFALWTWRQLTGLGLPCRFVVGKASRYGDGHAWVTATINGKRCLVEPLRHWVRPPLPRLSTLRYEPEVSVQWDGERLLYFRHDERKYEPRIAELPSLLTEWLQVWLPLSPRIGRGFLRRGTRLTSRLSMALLGKLAEF